MANRELLTRSLTGAALIALALTALWLGGIAFWLLAVVAALFMMAEWSDLHGATRRQKRLAQYALSVPLALMAPASLLIEAHPFFTLGLLAGAGFFVVIATSRPGLALGVVYCGLPVLALVTLRAVPAAGLLYTIWALGTVWATDIGAYFAGRSIGGPKIAPAISPSKTWAGLGGGMVGAGLFALALHRIEGLPLMLALASPLLAVLAQAGDFYESWLKRRAGVKDSGNVLPGHGGVLDRLDGAVPVAPVAALLALAAHAAATGQWPLL